MNYFAETIRDGSKIKSASFTDLSFPLVQQIENKIKNKALILRRKIRQKLLEIQRLNKTQDKRQESSRKQNGNYNKVEKDHFNYIEAYEENKNIYHHDSLPNLENLKLEEKQEENTMQIYMLMRKRKPIFKIEEVKRKFKNKQSSKRQIKSQCEICPKMGKKKCQHIIDKRQKSVKKNGEKGQKTNSIPPSDAFDDQVALQIAESEIQKLVKMQNNSMTVLQINRRSEQQISIPKIDNLDKQEANKGEFQQQEHFIERERISQNESKSEISESKKNKIVQNQQQQRNLQPSQLVNQRKQQSRQQQQEPMNVEKEQEKQKQDPVLIKQEEINNDG